MGFLHKASLHKSASCSLTPEILDLLLQTCAERTEAHITFLLFLGLPKAWHPLDRKS